MPVLNVSAPVTSGVESHLLVPQSNWIVSLRVDETLVVCADAASPWSAMTGF